jgi:hypothetical protein
MGRASAGQGRCRGRWLAVAVLALPALAAVGASPASAASAPIRVRVQSDACAPGWTAPNPGRRRLRLINATGRTATLVLYHPRNGKVVLRPAPLRARARRTVSMRFPPGVYAWRCTVRGAGTRTSEVSRVPIDPVIGRPGGLVSFPVQFDELGPPLAAYRRYGEGQLAAMGASVGALRTALAGGDVAGARTAWLAARLAWERVGAAYGALGASGRAISTTAAGLPGGTSDPRFTGLHRVEHDLWQTGDLVAARRDTEVLAAAVARLAGSFPTRGLPRTDLPLRAHEILEDGLRDDLTGRDDYGSGSSLAAVRADSDATRSILGFLADLIDPRSPNLLARATHQLGVLDAALEATRVNGTWVAVRLVPLAQRQRVNAAIGAVLETIAPVPDLLSTGKS